MSDLEEAVERWAHAVEWLVDVEADEDDDVIAALLWRDGVHSAVASGERLTPQSARELQRADRAFVAMRSSLVAICPDVFRGDERGATPEEWWWWPDRMPADGIARAS